ncbi:response regulator [Brevibacterium sp. 5221]|uniref:Response regulator n=1 Tax=Brevibacterium rongguiense TaxID=2695267 RepID=A0A6N9H9R9_9MICO|nr:response regulator transcription factor [Brevibacterium rongguiense]MYM20797.1 response regulator [Brevibacterium rongguiense]
MTAAPTADPEQLRVLLVDDQPLLRAGFAMVIDSQPDLRVIGQAGDGAEAIALLARQRADVVLMDIRMPRLDGLEATRRIVAGDVPAAGPVPKIIVLTTFDTDEYAYAALRAGASGFLLKDAAPEALLEAIRTVHRGGAVVAPTTTRRLLDSAVLGAAQRTPDPQQARLLAALTEREREVLIEVASGDSNADIAARLVLSEATVKTHVGRILAKLRVRDRVQAVVFAYEAGLITPGH